MKWNFYIIQSQSTWALGRRRNEGGNECARKVQDQIVHMSFRPELQISEFEELKQREKVSQHDSLHEIVTHYKKNQVSAWFRRNSWEISGVTCCWFDWKPSNAELNNLEQGHPFTWRSEQKMIEGISVYLANEDGTPYSKKAVATNHQIQKLPSSHEFPPIKRKYRAVSNALHWGAVCPTLWLLSSTFFPEIHEQYHLGWKCWWHGELQVEIQNFFVAFCSFVFVHYFFIYDFIYIVYWLREQWWKGDWGYYT